MCDVGLFNLKTKPILLTLIRLLHDSKKILERISSLLCSLVILSLMCQVPGAWHIEYGLWQDFGTGKEIPRGNHGDIVV